MKKQIAVLEIYRRWDRTGVQYQLPRNRLGEILFGRCRSRAERQRDRLFNSGRCQRKAHGLPGDQKILDYRRYTKVKFHLRGWSGNIYQRGMAGSTAASTRRSRRQAGSPARSRTSRTFRSAWSLDGRSGRSLFLPRGRIPVPWMPDYSLWIEICCVLAHMSGDERLIGGIKPTSGYPRHHGVPGVPYPVKAKFESTAAPQREGRELQDRKWDPVPLDLSARTWSISRKEAMEYIERYFETYPQVDSFLDSLVAHAKGKGTSPPCSDAAARCGVKILELYAAFLSASAWR